MLQYVAVAILAFVVFFIAKRVFGGKKTSGVKGLKLEFDRARTPAFLDAKLEGPTEMSKTRWSWRLTASI